MSELLCELIGIKSRVALMLAMQILQLQLASLRQRVSCSVVVEDEDDDDDFTEDSGVCIFSFSSDLTHSIKVGLERNEK